MVGVIMNRYDTLTDNERILFDALQEISIKLHDSNDNPVSLSLYLWNLGIDDPEAKDKLFRATIKLVLATADPMELTVSDFQTEFSEISAVFSKIDNDTVWINYIVSWIGLNLFPAAYPVAQNLSEEQ